MDVAAEDSKIRKSWCEWSSMSVVLNFVLIEAYNRCQKKYQAHISANKNPISHRKYILII